MGEGERPEAKQPRLNCVWVSDESEETMMRSVNRVLFLLWLSGCIVV